MRVPSHATNYEDWPWLHELERPSPAFWELLSQMGKTSFEVQSQATAYSGTIDLEQAFLSECDHFLTTRPSLNLATSAVDKVYLREPDANSPSALELDFKDRQSLLRFPGLQEEAANLIANLFGWELKPETTNLAKKRQLAATSVCQCCAGAAKKRRADIANNPFHTILTILTQSEEEVALTLHSPSMNLVTPFRAQANSIEDRCLVVESDQQSFLLDVGHLHGLVVKPSLLEQREVTQLALYNSHGTCFASMVSHNPDHLALFQNVLRKEPAPYQ